MASWKKNFIHEISHANFGRAAWSFIHRKENYLDGSNVKTMPFYDDYLYSNLVNEPISLVCETCWGGDFFTYWD